LPLLLTPCPLFLPLCQVQISCLFVIKCNSHYQLKAKC
jgi:hypothetical protein